MAKNGVDRFWTTREDRYLREHYPTSSRGELEAALNRSWSSIRMRAFRIGACKPQKGRKLTEEDVCRAWIHLMPVEVMAEQWGCTEKTIRRHQRKLGLQSYNMPFRKWFDSDEAKGWNLFIFHDRPDFVRRFNEMLENARKWRTQ